MASGEPRPLLWGSMRSLGLRRSFFAFAPLPVSKRHGTAFVMPKPDVIDPVRRPARLAT
jgi:hypothetical protein